MIGHHPPEESLLALAAGRLGAGPEAVVSAHVESCPECAGRLRVLNAVGGALLEQSEPHALAANALAATLQRLGDVPQRPPRRQEGAVPPAASWLPSDCAWPASLRGCELGPWRRVGPGRRICRVRLAHGNGGSLFLFGIEPGRSFPRHGHERLELTQVLCGAFSDGRAVFGPGDFDTADADVQHELVAQPGAMCVCLTWIEGRLRFDSGIAATIARWVGV
ncbi:cupin domain-containing protein [Ramlibacter sp. AW1]|uniref:Cupin domain-containing protein n=1 Tax=Ramlibacter aurantiacus TaxID=2801330 RepID=A0A936ZQK4_9BURK|nr:ChrR family anti-sigma-E factor [Ramlibacter aurantiacus]MBL0421891.1 cupin domain-containing protein [Ramlibacter aurantiacus]